MKDTLLYLYSTYKMIATIFRCIFLFSNSPIEYFQLPEIFTSFLPERIVSDRPRDQIDKLV